jgi:glycosyltransferase involved in cell wall biosynthesis
VHVIVEALSARGGGAVTYLTNLLKYDPPAGVEVSVIAPKTLDLSMVSNRIRRVPVAAGVELPPARLAWLVSKLPRLLRRSRADILFAPGGTVLGHVPDSCAIVTMFQNVLPFNSLSPMYGWSYQGMRLRLLRRVLANSMERADLVLFVSEHGRRVACEEAGVRVSRHVVLRHGVESIFFQRDAPRPTWAPSGRYIIYVSPIEPYKAQREVVEAFGRLRAQRPRLEVGLLLVGPEHRRYGRAVRADVIRHGLADSVVLTGAVPHEDLPGAYEHADAIVFASRCENCPIALLEALASGRPVLCSNRAPMPEHAGDIATYFDPDAPEELANLLVALLEGPPPESRQGLTSLASRHQWSVLAEQTWDAVCSARSRRA